MTISNSQKYIWNRGYLMLPISLDVNRLKEDIFLFGNTLVIKDEFHVSLFCNKNIPESAYKKIPNIEERILEIFYKLADNEPFYLEKRFLNFRFAKTEKGDRKSLVLMVSVKNLNLFYDKINTEFNLNLEYPPTHISLYTLKKNEAIGINNSFDLELLTEVVDIKLDVRLNSI